MNTADYLILSVNVRKLKCFVFYLGNVHIKDFRIIKVQMLVFIQSGKHPNRLLEKIKTAV